MDMTDGVTFSRGDLQQSVERQAFLDLSHEYFRWMNQEISQLCGFSIPTLVKMSISDYIALTLDIAAQISPTEGGIYFLRDAGGNTIAMGGLRRLPSGSAEIVRIYTRPESRGNGHGTTMIQRLISETRRLGYDELYLDTGVFMTSAQKIYRAAGFTACDPYPGAEPPEALVPYWLYMKHSL